MTLWPTQFTLRDCVALCACLFLGCAADSAQPATPVTTVNAAPAAAVGAAGAAGTLGNAAPAATFSSIYAMIFPRMTNAHCDMCHGLPPFDRSNGNLATGLDQATAYLALVGKASMSTLCAGKSLVVAGQPEASLLLQKLRPNPPCGLRMPNGGAALSDAQIEMVRSWIAAGAKND